jgi:hypothetical protein
MTPGGSKNLKQTILLFNMINFGPNEPPAKRLDFFLKRFRKKMFVQVSPSPPGAMQNKKF